MFLMLGYILETFCVYSIIIKWVNFHVFENHFPYIKLLHFCSFVCSVRYYNTALVTGKFLCAG